jgi:hypothetical protein
VTSAAQVTGCQHFTVTGLAADTSQCKLNPCFHCVPNVQMTETCEQSPMLIVTIHKDEERERES